MRKRAGALYIQDNRLLLISEGGQNLFWTPGGGVEEGEDFVQALERELQEELGAVLNTAKSFIKFYDAEDDEEVEYFLVDIHLPGQLTDDTRIYWYSKSDFESNPMPISRRVYTKVYPELLGRGVIS